MLLFKKTNCIVIISYYLIILISVAFIQYIYEENKMLRLIIKDKIGVKGSVDRPQAPSSMTEHGLNAFQSTFLDLLYQKHY